MPEQTDLFIDLPAIYERLRREGEALNAVEWTLDDDGEEQNVMVIVIPEPRNMFHVKHLARTLLYLLDASGYAPSETLRAALLAPTVNLDLKWEKDTNA